VAEQRRRLRRRNSHDVRRSWIRPGRLDAIALVLSSRDSIVGMKAKRPPTPRRKRQTVPNQSIGDALSPGCLSNINKAKTTSGCISHKRVGADRRHRQKSFSVPKFSVPSQKQGLALAGERSRPPSRMEIGSPSVARTHGFRYEDVDAGGQFWFAPSGHLESGGFDHAAASMYRRGLMSAVVRRGNSNFPLVIRQSWTFPGGDRLD
jgi:hypothetical protein